MHRLYRFSCNFIQILSVVFTGVLFVGSFLFTCYAENMTTQEVLTVIDNPLPNILGMVVLSGAALLITPPLLSDPKRVERCKKALLILVMGCILALGGLLILFGRTAPAADAWSVYSAAESLAAGDTSVIHPTDSYLSYYPQQVGLLAFFELLIRIWNLFGIDMQSYHFIKCLYVLLTCVIVWFQYKSVHLMWEDDRTDCLYLVLAGLNLPLIMYSSFVYGEIPSFAAMSAGIYFLLRVLKFTEPAEHNMKKNVRDAAFSLCALTLSVMLRKNSLILIIAILTVTTLEALHRKNARLLAYALLCLTLSLGILPVTQRIYEYRAGNYLQTGVPAMSYFAMGMQESSRGNGWYNGYNFNTYQDSDMDTRITVDISRSYIKERGEYFRSHPGYAAGFYLGKFLSQWADGTYASRQATLATLGERHPIMQALYDGAYSPLYIGFCNIYQSVLYLFCFLYFLERLTANHRRQSAGSPAAPLLYPFLGIIGAFGGFLFHMIWEANARYIFLYSLLLIPYAAAGLSAFHGRLRNLRHPDGF